MKNNINNNTTKQPNRRSALFGVASAAVASLAGSQLSFGQNPVSNTTPFALPQIAYGGGWNTTLYFANTNDNSAATVTLNFFDSEGSPLQVSYGNNAASETHRVDLNPRATGVVELENNGELKQGWVEVILPDGVTGYGVFRQTADGRADQEAVVQLVNETSMSAQLVYDDANFTTGLAIVNPSTARAQINIVAFNASGAQTGNATLALEPRARTAVTLRDLSGMAGVVGSRGYLSITASTGTIAVLGLRFGSAAFTSIPAVHK